MLFRSPVTADGFVAATAGGPALKLDRGTIGKFILSLPLNGFSNREWIPGSGDIRAGLTPTKTGCVHNNLGAVGTQTGPWMNGALTLQLVKFTTGAADVELNQSGDVAMGYRLKKDAISQTNQLAQYTMFWHHDNPCHGVDGWTKTPAPDTASSSTGSAPAGTADPTGTFATSNSGNLSGGTTGGSTTTTTTTYNGVEAYVVLTYDAAQDLYTRTTKAKSDNSVLKTENFKDDPNPEIKTADKQLGSPVRLGRMSWQEIVR